jgi:hypothetical protein
MSTTTLATAAVAALSLVGPFGVRSAAACSPPPPQPGYGSLIVRTPADGAAGVPTNGAIILDQELIGGVPKEVTVSLVEATTGAAVSGNYQSFYWDRLFLAWRPEKPLRPLTVYRVDAAVRSEAPRPATATGAESLSFTFTTGTGPVPSLDVQGQMQVSLETYEHQREDWSGCPMTSCGPVSGCTPRLVREQRTRARVSVPAFSGGLAEAGYFAVVPVTAETPYAFPRGDVGFTGALAVGSRTGIRPDAPSEILIELDALASQRPCFALRMADLAGSTRDLAPVCADATVQPTRSLEQSGGCRVAGDGGAPTWVGLALLALLWHRVSGRRRGSAPGRAGGGRPCS